MAATKKSTTTRVTTAKPKARKAAPAPAPAATAAAPVAPVAPASAPVPAAPVKPAARSISQGEWRSMVEQAAYYIAERKGFTGNPEDHWAAAEAQVRADLAAKNIKIA